MMLGIEREQSSAIIVLFILARLGDCGGGRRAI